MAAVTRRPVIGKCMEKLVEFEEKNVDALKAYL